eukprot:875437-Rhodomonas_salina.1
MPVPGSAACWACNANATSPPGAAFIWDCVCMPGFYMRESQCRPCPRGLFKTGPGNAACEACAENEEAAAPDSASCVCAPGYDNETGVCRQPLLAGVDGDEFAD